MLPQIQQAMHDAISGPVELMTTFSCVPYSQVLGVFLTFYVQLGPFELVVLVVFRK